MSVASLATIVTANGEMLDRVLQSTYPVWHDGLSRPAYHRFEAAQMKTAWARDHLRRVVLVDDDEILASARHYQFTAVLDREPVRVCGIGSVFTPPEHRGQGYARTLVERLLADAARDGAAIGLLFSGPNPRGVPRGFEAIPRTEVALTVTESARYGAPMTLVRAGEARDLAAIVAMGRSRATPFRFHLDRDVDAVQHAIIRTRLRAGLGEPHAREVQFFIAEEGVTAAAYVVLSVEGNRWMLEECGDRDPSGARVGAILQALIARAPGEARPSIHAWLPEGFLPPQVTIAAVRPSPTTLLMRTLGSASDASPLSAADVMYWHSDTF